MDWIAILNAAVVLVGVPVVAGVLINIGKNLKTIDSIEKDLRENIQPDLQDIRERFFTLEGKTSSLFETASPVRLMDNGKDVLQNSGLKSYLDENSEDIIKECSNGKKFSNPYDVQKAVFNLFDEYQFSDEFFDKLKRYAYNEGINLNTLRRIGAIYFRDICIQHHDMTPEDIDKHDPQKKETVGT